MRGNAVYGNAVGILAQADSVRPYGGSVQGNLVYANSDLGILVFGEVLETFFSAPQKHDDRGWDPRSSLARLAPSVCGLLGEQVYVL